MPKDVEMVVARYRRSLRYGRCQRRADGDLDRQAGNYGRRFALQSTTETMLRQVLMSHAISTIFIVHYLNFGRRMARLAGHYRGETLSQEALHAISEWEAIGLSRAVLEEICWNVFDVPVDRGTSAL